MELIKAEEIVNLSQSGVSAPSFKFSKIGLSCDHHISLIDDENDSIVLIDLENPEQIDRFPNRAHGALRHPTDPAVIALRKGSTIQLLDIKQKASINSASVSSDILFLAFLSDDIVGIVTSRKLYTWKYTREEKPHSVAVIDPALADGKITGLEECCGWFAVTALVPIDGKISGRSQLISPKHKSRVLEAFCCSLGSFGQGSDTTATVMAFADKDTSSKRPEILVHMIEVGRKGGDFTPRSVKTRAHGGEADFPFKAITLEKYGFVAVVTKRGWISIFDLGSGELVHTSNPHGPLAISTALSNDGILVVTNDGVVSKITFNEDILVSHVSTRISPEAAYDLSKRARIPGPPELFITRFEKEFGQSEYVAASEVVLTAPDLLRTDTTLSRFQSSPPSTPPAILVYLSTLLKHGTLNKAESRILATSLIDRGKEARLGALIREDLLHCSEELGDQLVRSGHPKLGASVFVRAGCHGRVLKWLVEVGDVARLVAYVVQQQCEADFTDIARVLVRRDPSTAIQLGSALASESSIPDDAINGVADTIVSFDNGLIKDVSNFLIERCSLSSFGEESTPFQTQILLLNLRINPDVADSILKKRRLVNFDKEAVSVACKRAGLWSRAIELVPSGQRSQLISEHGASIPDQWFISFLGTLEDSEDKIDIIRQIVQIGREPLAAEAVLSADIPVSDILGLFEDPSAKERILVPSIAANEDPAHHMALLEAELVQKKWVEAAEFILKSDLIDSSAFELVSSHVEDDLLPLANLCGRFEMGERYGAFIASNDRGDGISVFLSAFPALSGALATGLISTGLENRLGDELTEIAGVFDVDSMLASALAAGRFQFLRPVLTTRIRELSLRDKSTQTGLALVLVESSEEEAVKFLKGDIDIDFELVGNYCLAKGSYGLGFTVFASGSCDAELVTLANEQSMFSELGSELVHRKDLEFWDLALSECGSDLVSEVCSNSILHARDGEEVTVTTKAFLGAGLNQDLIRLLERLILDEGQGAGDGPSLFGHAQTLQNLLLLTAVKFSPDRVLGYVRQLEDYSGTVIAGVCVSARLYEEAYEIHDRQGRSREATAVLLQHFGIQRAKAYAADIGEPSLFALVGRAELSEGMTSAALLTLAKSGDLSSVGEAIRAVTISGQWEELLPYLEAVREMSGHDVYLDTELIICLGRLSQLERLQQVLENNTVARLDEAADKLYGSELFDAAKLVFRHLDNLPGLASCCVRLKQYEEALTIAKRADSAHIWRELNATALLADEDSVARASGLALIGHGEVDALHAFYTRHGRHESLIELFETASRSAGVSSALFELLARLFLSYASQKLLPFMKEHSSRLDLPALVPLVEAASMWLELVWIYSHVSCETDALRVMLTQEGCWDDELAVTIAPAINDVHVLQQAAAHLMATAPPALLPFLNNARLDASTVVQLARHRSRLRDILPYLEECGQDVEPVNLALQELYLESGEPEKLAGHLRSATAFDRAALGGELLGREEPKFRRLGIGLIAQTGDWERALDAAFSDTEYDLAVKLGQTAGTREVCESVLTRACALQDDEARASLYCKCLEAFGGAIRPAIALKLAWSNSIVDQAIPFLCSVMEEWTVKMDKVDILWKHFQQQ